MEKNQEYFEKFVKNALDLALEKPSVLKKKGRKKYISKTDQRRMIIYILNLLYGKPIVPVNGRTTRPLTQKEEIRTIYSMQKILSKYDFIE